MKKFISIVLLVVMIVSSFCLSVSAASASTSNGQWSNKVTVTLSSTKKDAYVTVTAPSWGAIYDIKMICDGKVVWSENNSFRANSNAANTYRVYRLGGNHKTYQLQFRSKSLCAPSVKVTASTKSEIKNYIGVNASNNCKSVK